MSSALRQRLAPLFDLLLVVTYLLFLWSPWDRGTQSSPVTLAWLALPVTLARYGVNLASATIVVTICALIVSAAGAAISIVGRMRASQLLRAAGAWIFGISVAILMPTWSAVGFAGALLLVLALQVRFSGMTRQAAASAVLAELWPIAYTIAFAVLAWRYNPQLLLKALLISFGAGLIARAALPTSAAPPEARAAA